MQHKSVPISRGLFLVRYEAAQDVFNPPRARVTPEPGSERFLIILSDPNSLDSVLGEPGTCLVVRASEPARLRVEVIPSRENGSVAATIKVEPLGQTTTAAAPQLPPRPLDLHNFAVRGHVAGIGDLSVRAEEWIAGPTAPSRIEGFAINWPSKPADLEIAYAARIGGPNPTTTALGGMGTFAGTKGRALPLVGAVFELSGPAATNYQFIVEGIFLGSPRNFQSGTRVVLAGPTGREPLVGLRVGLEQAAAVPVPKPTQQYAVTAPPTEHAPATELASSKPSSRVRVFRSPARQRAAAMEPKG